MNNSNTLKKWLLISLGFISLILGIVCILVPVLPTTPFLLLSAWSFLRGSQRLHDWLLNHPWFGEYIRNFQEYKAIPLKTKISAVLMLWVTILFSILMIVKSTIIRLVLIGIAIVVTIHILHYKTLQKEDDQGKVN